MGDIRSVNFFRTSLINLSPSQIEEELVRLDNDIKQFKQELFRIVWYMRGGVTITDLMDRFSYEDREYIYKVIEENLETVKNTQLPLL